MGFPYFRSYKNFAPHAKAQINTVPTHPRGLASLAQLGHRSDDGRHQHQAFCSHCQQHAVRCPHRVLCMFRTATLGAHTHCQALSKGQLGHKSDDGRRRWLRLDMGVCVCPTMPNCYEFAPCASCNLHRRRAVSLPKLHPTQGSDGGHNEPKCDASCRERQ